MSRWTGHRQADRGLVDGGGGGAIAAAAGVSVLLGETNGGFGDCLFAKRLRIPAAVGTTTGGATVAAVAARRRGGWGMRFRPPAPVEDDELPEPELLDDDELLDDELDELELLDDELLDDDGGGCCRRGRRAGRSDWMTTRSRRFRWVGAWLVDDAACIGRCHFSSSHKHLTIPRPPNVSNWGGAMAVFVQRGLNCEKMRR